ncbi:MULTISPECIES: AAA family ATPase [Nonomuraea]|uniref:AAA family ATPase n=1 Tax=Nonomuraea mangrovi TaxID=2316207 RepID=A0ABW4SU71_9ACTN
MLVVLVNGLPGAGKTTLAKPLADELDLPLLSKDRIKETLADTLGVTPPAGLTARAWSQKLGVAAGETLWALLCDAGQGAVLESFWLRNLRPVVTAGLHRAGAGTAHEVRCVLPLRVARQRYEEREARRHAIHLGAIVGDLQWKELERQAQPLDLGHTYDVDTTRPVDIPRLAKQIRQRAGRKNASDGATPAPN